MLNARQVPIRAWLVIAAGSQRQHGGNDGYDDNPAVYYSWDSTVPNHARPAAGDAIVIWDKRLLLGASVIDEIAVGSTSKPVYRCPRCHRAAFKERKRFEPRFLCSSCHAAFDQPERFVETVQTFRSEHHAAWMDLAGAMAASELRALCVSPRSQLSLRPFRWDAFASALCARFGYNVLAAPDRRARQLAAGHRIATLRVRVGQAAFRKLLLSTFGPTCAFTGPAPIDALEACHLYSYATLGEHHDYGGLLLRRDLHRLFDLGLLAVNPKTLTIDAKDVLHGYPAYHYLHGKPLAVNPGKERIRWLRDHWEEHRLASRAIT